MASFLTCTMSLVLSLFIITIVSLPGVMSWDLRAIFDMSGIKGEVKFSKNAAAGSANITLNLTGLTTDYLWKIHNYPVVYRGNSKHTCQTLYTGKLFDPFSKESSGSYATQCNASMPQNPNLCAVGDLSGKHGYLKSTTSNLYDPNLPLSGPNSIFSRSLVLYNGSTPIACALIDWTDDVITAVAKFRGKFSGVTGTVRFRQSRSKPSMDTSIDVNLFYSNDVTSGAKNLTLTISDKQIPDGGVPSYEGSSCPASSEKGSVISEGVNIPLAQNGPSKERLLFSVQDVPLTGAKPVVGNTLVLWQNNSPIICASIYELLPLEAEGVFAVDGVEGSIHFKQSSELSPTVVTVDLKGLKSKANEYHVHVYRVLDSVMKSKKNTRKMCGADHVAGHWNPYDVSSASPGTGTVDEYEIGDLSGKYGTIGGKDRLFLKYNDYNLPLFGANSILFRSLVIHYNDKSRWICTNINPKNPTYHLKAQATFIGPDFNGSITVEQASFVKKYAASHITTFFLDLKNMNKSEPKTPDHKWHIHSEKLESDQMYKMGERCKSSLGHYNPYGVSLKSNYKTNCSPMNLMRCELGDLSSKLAKYEIGGGKNRFTESENYFASLNSILGRSIVVHTKDAGAPRLGCANLETTGSSFSKKEFTYKKNSAITSDFQKTISDALKVKQWRVANVQTINSKNEDCKTASFILVESSNSNLSKDFENLEKNWPSEKFTPCPSKAVHLQSTYFLSILIISALVCLFK